MSDLLGSQESFGANEPLTGGQPLGDNSAFQGSEISQMQTTVMADKEFPNDWRVEMIEAETGDIFVAVFSGPDAEERAREYAQWQEAKQKRRIAA